MSHILKIQKVHKTIVDGDLDKLRKMLRHVDINCLSFGENLLMTAVRCRNFKIAKMLLKRRIDCGHKALKFDLVSLSENEKIINCYFVSCPQMAYDFGMYDLVDLIEDHLKAVKMTTSDN